MTITEWCEFPSCVEGQKPTWCGTCDEATHPMRQIRLLPDPCAICGRHTGLMIEQGGVFACVECHTKENGEDGDG